MRALLALVLLLPLAARADEPATLDGVMAALAQVPARTQDFTETRSLRALAHPVASRGTLEYVRPDRLVQTTLAPRPETLRAEGDTLTLQEGSAAPRRIALGDAPALRALVDAVRGTLSGDLPLLRRSYAPSIAGTMRAWTLTLLPRGAAASLLSVVRVEGAGDVVDTVQIAQANGDQEVMRIALPGQGPPGQGAAP